MEKGRLQIVKYCGSGNDFLIFTDEWKANSDMANIDNKDLAIKLCDRHYGIGADGLVYVKPQSELRTSYMWEFYNCDGSRASMCGNASRCVGAFAYRYALADRNHAFQSDTGIIKISVMKDDIVKSDLGVAKDFKQVDGYYLLDTGVPHLVWICDSQEKLDKLSKDIPTLRALREKYNANVNIALIESKGQISLATYERGVEDITLACGTGMAAVFYVANHLGMAENECILLPPSKEKLILSIVDSHLYFAGRVAHVATCYV